ncbi:MAG: polyphosphate polymerase domain-containing protein [Candidatus Krumholzibacteriota bacterium]
MVKPASDYRFERKFLVTDLEVAELEAIVRHHPAVFGEIYHPRFINNIYFDTLDATSYVENVEGFTSRVKFRVRWYEDLFGQIPEPVLELKIKHGFLGRKESFPLSPFHFDGNTDFRQLLAQVWPADLPPVIADGFRRRRPALLNRYLRRYYQSADGDFRITIDRDQEFREIRAHGNSFLHRRQDSTTLILELKYNYELDERAQTISSVFPFRMTKSSKFVNGTERLLP